MSEGHTRPVMMLNDRPKEQNTLFKEILYKKITVREAEQIARRIAYNKIRKKDYLPDPELISLEKKLQETLGTRVHIERKDNGGKIMIDFFSPDDLNYILGLIESNKEEKSGNMLEKFISKITKSPEEKKEEILIDDRSPEEKKESDEESDLYDIKNFSL